MLTKHPSHPSIELRIYVHIILILVQAANISGTEELEAPPNNVVHSTFVTAESGNESSCTDAAFVNGMNRQC